MSGERRIGCRKGKWKSSAGCGPRTVGGDALREESVGSHRDGLLV